MILIATKAVQKGKRAKLCAAWHLVLFVSVFFKRVPPCLWHCIKNTSKKIIYKLLCTRTHQIELRRKCVTRDTGSAFDHHIWCGWELAILLLCLSLLHPLGLGQRSVAVNAKQLLRFAFLSTQRALCFFQAPAGNTVPAKHVPTRSCRSVLPLAQA